MTDGNSLAPLTNAALVRSNGPSNRHFKLKEELQQGSVIREHRKLDV